MKGKLLTQLLSLILCFSTVSLSACTEQFRHFRDNAPPLVEAPSEVPIILKTPAPTPTPAPSVVATTPSNTPLSEKLELYRYIAEGEAEWLASLQLENGAIPMTYMESGTMTVNPYFADFAALAMLRGGEKYYDGVRAYIGWHFKHLNTAKTDYNGLDGTIYDYTVTTKNGKLTDEKVTYKSNGTPSYDSVDSYAATFLHLLINYCDQTGDKALLQKNSKDIQRIYHALTSLMDEGLTWTKPDYRIKYLMDNCEVYEGLAAAERLFGEVLEVPELAAEAAEYKGKVADALETQMWREAGYYEAALGDGDTVAYTFSWDSFYPCATAQLLTVSCGLLEPADPRAIQLYNSFNANYSTGEKKHTWEDLSIPDSFFWGSIVYTAALMGDEARVETYMQHYKKAMRTHTYPLYNADAARVCLAAEYMLDILSEQEGT